MDAANDYNTKTKPNSILYRLANLLQLASLLLSMANSTNEHAYIRHYYEAVSNTLSDNDYINEMTKRLSGHFVPLLFVLGRFVPYASLTLALTLTLP